MNFEAVIVGVSSLVIIGAFHPIVIKAEYHFSSRCWWAFAPNGDRLLADCPTLAGALVLHSRTHGSACLWSIVELFHQEKRIEKGWFPKNPKRAQKEKAND